MPFSQPPRQKYLSAAVIANTVSPFLGDQPLFLESAAGTTVYGAKKPGDGSTTKYAKFKQTISGNKAFTLPTAADTPLATTGTAVTAANQLRTIVLKNGVPVPHTRDDQVAAAASFCVGAGGGTAVGDTTIIIKGTTAANIALGATTLSIASTGANTKTLLVGDKITNDTNGDTTVYRVTATSATLNGTTEVNVAITPPLQKAAVASDALTITAADAKTVLFATAPAVNDVIEVMPLAAADVVTLTGGALTAGRIYEAPCYDFMHAAGNVNLTAAVG